jgi:hypothetical protein
MKLATCIGCGCDDNHACIDGFEEACHWLRVDRRTGIGVCSQCPTHTSRWDGGDRSRSETTAQA